MPRRPIPRQADKSHLIARLHRGLRPQLDRSPITALALAHTVNPGLIRTDLAAPRVADRIVSVVAVSLRGFKDVDAMWAGDAAPRTA